MKRDVPITRRANELLNLKRFANADQTVNSWPLPKIDLDIPDDQYIRSMMLSSSESSGLHIPTELQWLSPVVQECLIHQSKLGKRHPFIYVTVCAGVVRSLRDDEWHVDGFSLRTPHEPEQNYVWTDSYPTEHLVQQFEIPDDFDALKHNLHQFFQDRADESKIKTLAPEHLHLIDPYIVHRRPTLGYLRKRTFFRISFVPIEIEDDSNTPNPLLPVKLYGRDDIRSSLTRY